MVRVKNNFLKDMVKTTSKYGSKKVIIDGIKFDSKKEGKRYLELKLLEKANEIKNLELQKVFELQPSFKKNGKTYRKITYKADFCYFSIKENKYICEDVKSPATKTQVYMIKKKMLLYKYENIEFREVI